MHCSNCGKELGGGIFCEHCGSKIGVSANVNVSVPIQTTQTATLNQVEEVQSEDTSGKGNIFLRIIGIGAFVFGGFSLLLVIVSFGVPVISNVYYDLEGVLANLFPFRGFGEMLFSLYDYARPVMFSHIASAVLWFTLGFLAFALSGKKKSSLALFITTLIFISILGFIVLIEVIFNQFSFGFFLFVVSVLVEVVILAALVGGFIVAIKNKDNLVKKPAPKVVAPYSPGVQGVPAAMPGDAPSFGYAVLGFFFPIVGLILFIVWKDQYPLRSKSAGKGALISVIVNAALGVLAVLAMVIFMLVISS